MLYESRITRQGQTTIPKHLREKYGLGEGDEVTYIDLGDHIILLPKPRDPIEALKRIRVETDKTVQEIKREAHDAAMRDALRDRGEQAY
jgi:AbrB family looped-hinge helix DNA binding protein